jgi:glutathione-regulated potassium-efflux system protein KefB
VVMLLFLIGLELELGRLLAMRRDIFGLGAAQLILTALAIAGLVVAAGLASWRGAAVAGLALAMSATAITLQILQERGELQQDYGQRAFAILLFQDMAVVPLLALLPLLAGGGGHTDLRDGITAAALVAGAIALIVIAGRYLLNPLFRLLAQTGAREVMTAAALLVVLGAALIMHKAGMSMALGAFLAGVLLAESNYRHEHRSRRRVGQPLADHWRGPGHHAAQGCDRVAAVPGDLCAPRRRAARGIGAHRGR